MQIYLLALNLFALAALLLGSGNLFGRTRSSRLLPLFLLVVARSLALIMALTGWSGRVSGALEVFSTFCVVWVLTGPVFDLPSPWPALARLGAGGSILLALLPLFSFWPAPPQLNSLIIAVFSPLLVMVSHGRPRWTHLAPPLLVTLANFLNLVGLSGVSWLANLLAYAFLINAIHWESVQIFNRTYQSRQQAAEILVQETINLSREQQRLLEASREISSVSDLSQSLEHIARSMAGVAHADQSAIFMLDVKQVGQARLATVYDSRSPVSITSRDEIVFSLDDFPPLRDAIESQRQLLLPEHAVNGLRNLYTLWHEARSGPTLIQPLAVQGRPVGALLLGNPVSRRPIARNDADLCSRLALQIATMVEHSRRYLDLEWQAETMAAAVQEQVMQAGAARTVETYPVATRPVAPVPTTEAPAVQVELPPEPAPEPATPPPAVAPAQEQEEEAAAGQVSTLEIYRAVLESVSDGVVVSNRLGQVCWVNRTAEQILGQPAHTLVGQPISAIYGKIDAREPIEDLVVDFSRRNRPLPTFVETKEQAIQGRLIPWRNQNREWLGIIAVFRDVTREIKAEQSRKDFITALSHELRAPLTTIKGYSELILNGAMANYQPDQLRVQQIIHSSAEKMVEVLDNAIQISAESRNRMLPRFEQVDVVGVVNQALHAISPLAQVNEITLSQELKPDLPPISADPAHLRRIVDNLLSNACRFTPPGGRVTVRAWVAEPQPQKGRPAGQPELLVSVADTGVGIPHTELKRIFDPFYQLGNPTVEGSSGMGMGLAVVKTLVELHNGRVWVESTPGEGSIFNVALPLAQ